MSGIIVCVVYHPPSSPHETLLIDHLLSVLDILQTKYPNAGVILLGDFNKLDIASICRLSGLIQVVKTPTRGQAILDNILTNQKDLYHEPQISTPIGLSDHNSVTWHPLKPSKKTNVNHKRVIRPIRDSDQRAFGRWITSYNWEGVEAATTTEEKTSSFYEVLNTAIDFFFPSKVISSHGNDKPWITPELKSLIIKRQKAFSSGKLSLWRLLRNRIIRLIKRAKQVFYNSSVGNLKKLNSRQWHHHIKKLTGHNIKRSYTLPGSSPESIANTINRQFITVAQDIPKLDCNSLPAYLPMISSPPSVSPQDVFIKLKKLNINKSGGPDCIPPRVIKEFSYELSFPLCQIINCSLQEGIVPVIWKRAFVIPVPKSNPPNIDNLRPISLTCLFSKVFEDFVVKWIMDDIKNSIDICQFGSLKGVSTTHCLVKLLDDIFKGTDRPQHSAVLVATDFSKAFDRVNHQIVVEKFLNLGVRPSVIPWVCSFLSNRTQAVRYNGSISSWEITNAGVPQGTKLGPVAFLATINDFVSNSPEVSHFKYVDDMSLVQTYRKNDQTSSMQQQLDCLQEWSSKNYMRLNPTKCQVMISCFQRHPPAVPSFHIGHSVIKQTNCVKLLGIHVQDNLKWDTQVNYMCKAFNKKLYFLRQLKRCNIPINDLKTVYLQYVRPSLEYASPAWFCGLTKTQRECLEKMQRKAFRIILTADLCSSGTYGEICRALGVHPLMERLEQLSLNFGKSLLSSTKHRDWLPPSRNNNLRNSNSLSTIMCRTNRYKTSPIPYLTTILNK